MNWDEVLVVSVYHLLYVQSNKISSVLTQEGSRFNYLLSFSVRIEAF